MTIRADKADLLSGAMVAAIGGAFVYGALDYRLGTLVRMGPGYLPMAFGIITVVLGLLIMLLSLGREGAVPLPAPRAVLAVLGSIAVFALLLPRFGLIAAIVAAVLIATRGDRDARLMTSLLLAAVAAPVCWFVFVYLLGMPMQAFRLPTP